MLVHVERDNRSAAGEPMGVIGGPLHDKAVQALRPDEQGPAGAAGLSLGTGRELGAPALHRTEVALDRLRELGRWFASGPAEPIKVDLVQDHRACRDQLLALQAVHLEHRSTRPIEAAEPLLYRVKSPQRAAVIVLVVAREEPLG